MMDSDYDIVHTAMEIPTFARALNAEPKSQLFLKENQDSVSYFYRVHYHFYTVIELGKFELK